MTTTRIPPVNVPAYEGYVPPADHFRKQPAASFQAGDLLLLSTGIHWIVSRRERKTTPRIMFICYPCAGGHPIRREWFPREWVPAYREASR